MLAYKAYTILLLTLVLICLPQGWSALPSSSSNSEQKQDLKEHHPAPHLRGLSVIGSVFSSLLTGVGTGVGFAVGTEGTKALINKHNRQAPNDSANKTTTST